MRTENEIKEKIDEITARIIEEPCLEIATRACCERDALNWAMGENEPLHDMRKWKDSGRVGGEY